MLFVVGSSVCMLSLSPIQSLSFVVGIVIEKLLLLLSMVVIWKEMTEHEEKELYVQKEKRNLL